MSQKLLPGIPLPVFRPALALAVPFLLGIAAADAANLETRPLVLSCLANLVLAAVSAISRGRVAVRLALVSASLFAGATRMAIRLDPAPDHIANRLAPGGNATLSAIVVSPPVPWPDPPWQETAARRSAGLGSSFEVDVENVSGPPPCPATGRVRVSSYVALPAIDVGDRVLLHGSLLPLRGSRNPEQADAARRYARFDIRRTLVLTDAPQLEILQRAASRPFWRLIEVARRRLNGFLAADLRPDVADFMGALLFGIQADLPRDVAADFRRTGTLHYLAISGFHLMLIWGMLSGAFSAIGWRGLLSKGFILAALAMYTLLTGLLASAVRSFLMVAAVVGADFARRRRDALSSLGVAAWIICAVDPAQAFDAGFQLSFISVLGILWIYPILRAMATRPSDPLRRLWPPTQPRAWCEEVERRARDGACISMAAWLATAPFVASLFHLVTPVINAANLVLGPLVSIEIVGAVVKTATGAVGGWPDSLVAAPLEWIYDAMVSCGRALAALPGAWTPVAGMASAGVLLYLLALALWVRFCRLPRRRLHVLGLLPLLAFLGLARTSPSPPDGFRVSALDVGQGSAHVCETPEGGVIVYDCGSSSYADPGRAVVGPYLWSRGITTIDLLILSHPDADHINGAASLLEGFRIAAVAVSSEFERATAGAWTARRAMDEGARLVRLGAGDRVEGAPGAIVELLGPPSDGAASGWSDNDASLLARVRAPQGASALFTGDVQTKGIAALLSAVPDDVAADVVALPHHGSKSSRSPPLAAEVRASFALVSARRGFASERVLDDYRRAGAAVLGTWEFGAVGVEREGTRWRVMTYLGGWR